VRLDVLAIGRLKAGPERELCQRYTERLSGMARGLGFSGPRLFEAPESAARRDADRKAEEAQVLLGQLLPGSRVILFDEGGRSIDSRKFASILAGWRDSGAPAAACVIGGADGLGEAIRAKADLVLAFGGMTMPHQIVRALVMEQLYRAATILSGHPYHRD
jgi:23S rRNA (pseudouridine1915-N3)-methyltransferase